MTQQREVKAAHISFGHKDAVCAARPRCGRPLLQQAHLPTAFRPFQLGELLHMASQSLQCHTGRCALSSRHLMCAADMSGAFGAPLPHRCCLSVTCASTVATMATPSQARSNEGNAHSAPGTTQAPQAARARAVSVAWVPGGRTILTPHPAQVGASHKATSDSMMTGAAVVGACAFATRWLRKRRQ